MLTLDKGILEPIENSGNPPGVSALSKNGGLQGPALDSVSGESRAPDHFPNAKAVEENGSLALSDLDKALVEAAKEMTFDWPELLSVERIASDIGQIALRGLVAAGLAVLGRLFLFCLAS